MLLGRFGGGFGEGGSKAYDGVVLFTNILLPLLCISPELMSFEGWAPSHSNTWHCPMPRGNIRNHQETLQTTQCKKAVRWPSIREVAQRCFDRSNTRPVSRDPARVVEMRPAALAQGTATPQPGKARDGPAWCLLSPHASKARHPTQLNIRGFRTH